MTRLLDGVRVRQDPASKCVDADQPLNDAHLVLPCKLTPLQELCARGSKQLKHKLARSTQLADVPVTVCINDEWHPKVTLAKYSSFFSQWLPELQPAGEHLCRLCISLLKALKAVKELLEDGEALRVFDCQFVTLGSLKPAMWLSGQQPNSASMQSMLLRPLLAHLISILQTAANVLNIDHCSNGYSSSSSSRDDGEASSKAAPAAEEAGSEAAAALEPQLLQQVPWLVVLGRCCLAWAEMLPWDDGTANAQRPDAAVGTERVGQQLSRSLRHFQESLQDSDMSAQLAAAGYSAQPLLPLLQAAATALEAAEKADWDAGSCLSSCKRWAWPCNTLPIDCACNNPTAATCQGCQSSSW
jgi:hypothetical protein